MKNEVIKMNIFNLENLLEDYDDEMSEDEKEEVLKSIESLRKLVEGGVFFLH